MTRPSLSYEERALADKLARITPRAEPSAALDAKILALAARAPAAATAPAQRKPRRWLPPLALAASLTLVAGFIWRVHPVLNLEAPTQTAINEADMAANLPPSQEAVQPAQTFADTAITAAPASPASSAATPVAAAAPSTTPPPAAAPATPPKPQAVMAKSLPSADAQQKSQASDKAKPVAAMASQAALRSAETTDMPAPPPAAPPAPPAPAARMSAAPEAERAQSLDSIMVDGSRNLPSDAEITHIRALLAQGDTRKARRALKKLMRRHPDMEIPDDLKPLLD